MSEKPKISPADLRAIAKRIEDIQKNPPQPRRAFYTSNPTIKHLWAKK